MKYIKTDWSIPYWNMAFEDYLMNTASFDDDYVFFYIHKPSIIVGKHQNTYAEINETYVKEHEIIVARRISGGGAVYHDGGNLNFSFVFRRREGEMIDFQKYTLPVIAALKELGIESELSGRNDILIDGKKFSGNAQLMNKTKVLHHGTLMFDVDIEALVNALNVSQLKIESKAIESVRSRVANLKDSLSTEITIDAFREHLIRSFYQNVDFEEYRLTEHDLAETEKRVLEKYGTWEHNFGASPDFAITKRKKYDAGIVEAHINVSEGVIEAIKIYGDFFFTGSIEELEHNLIGAQFSEDGIGRRLDEIAFDNVIVNLKRAELIDLLCY